MGFEVKYRFSPMVAKGEYDKSVVNEATITVGAPEDEIGLDVLAGKVMALMARRNILVVEVEIFEYTKKRLAFKEAEDGIVIKNRKFRFDDGPVTLVGEDVPAEDAAGQLAALLKANPQLASLIQNPQNAAAQQPAPVQRQAPQQPAPVQRQPQPAAAAPVEQATGKKVSAPLQFEQTRQIYDPPEKWMIAEHRKKGFALTVGRKYAIYSEKKENPNNVLSGMIYEVIDDSGNKISVSERCFVPEVRLETFGDAEIGVEKTFVPSHVHREINGKDEMPSLR